MKINRFFLYIVLSIVLICAGAALGGQRGVLMGVIASVVLAVIMKKQKPQYKEVRMTDERTRCPYCAEEILATARKCKHCGEWIGKAGGNSSSAASVTTTL